VPTRRNQFIGFYEDLKGAGIFSSTKENAEPGSRKFLSRRRNYL
jgi:hypothetical protein